MRQFLVPGHEAKKMTFIVNGHKVDGVISIRYEFDEPNYDMLDESTKTRMQLDLKRGVMFCISITVECIAEGLTGRESLGQVFVRASKSEKDLLETVDTYKMTESAVSDVMTQILDAANRFQRYLTPIKSLNKGVS